MNKTSQWRFRISGTAGRTLSSPLFSSFSSMKVWGFLNTEVFPKFDHFTVMQCTPTPKQQFPVLWMEISRTKETPLLTLSAEGEKWRGTDENRKWDHRRKRLCWFCANQVTVDDCVNQFCKTSLIHFAAEEFCKVRSWSLTWQIKSWKT